MVEVVGDYLEPSELRVPGLSGGTIQPTYEGALFLSGAALYIVTSAGTELITST